MREEEEDCSNWFTKWEQELPSPEELIPLSQSLITPDLAIAFDLRATPQPQPQPNSSGGGDSTGGDSTGDQQQQAARTLKRPRLVWTPQLHKRFVDAVAHLGIKNAVPKTIMQLMSVDGLTRENVASHLQKYRLYLKRMQSGGSNNNIVGESDHLFATSHVPQHFLHQTGSDHHYIPSFVPIATTHGPQQQFYQHRHDPHHQSMFMARQSQVMRPASLHLHSQVGNYKEDLDNKTVLTLFPTSRDD